MAFEIDPKDYQTKKALWSLYIITDDADMVWNLNKPLKDQVLDIEDTDSLKTELKKVLKRFGIPFQKRREPNSTVCLIAFKFYPEENDFHQFFVAKYFHQKQIFELIITDPLQVIQYEAGLIGEEPLECLLFEMKTKGSEVSWIRNERHCKLPMHPGLEKGCKGGSLMVNLALRLCCLLGIGKLSLYDDSKVENSFGNEVDLFFLYILQYGQTWYESFGFQPKKFIEDKGSKAMHKQAIQVLQSTTKKYIEHVIEMLLESPNFPRTFIMSKKTCQTVLDFLKKSDIPDNSPLKDWGLDLFFQSSATFLVMDSLKSILLSASTNYPNFKLNPELYNYFKTIQTIVNETRFHVIDLQTACLQARPCFGTKKAESEEDSDGQEIQEPAAKRGKK